MGQTKRGRVPILLLLLRFAALLLRYPQVSAQAAREGLTLCFDLIIPALFPFFVLSSLFVSLGFAQTLGRFLRFLMAPLFRLNGSCASALILGAVGGYPVGMRTTAELLESGAIGKGDALRLSAFCNNCGPAFLLSVAGVGVFGSRTAGFLLMGTHLGASLLVGLCTRFLPVSGGGEGKAPPPGSAPEDTPRLSRVFPDCVKNSFFATLQISAFILLFTVLLRLGTHTGALTFLAEGLAAALPEAFTPALCQSLIAGVFELSTGITALGGIEQAAESPAALPAAAFMLGWGGLSVHCQSLPFLNRCGENPKVYFAGKLMQGIFAAVLTAYLAPYLHWNPAAGAVPLPALGALDGGTRLLLRREIRVLFILTGLFFTAVFFRQKRLANDKRR